MLKNDFDRVRYDDSIQMIVLKLIFVRRMRRGQHTIAATRTHVVTTLNALETTGFTRARKARQDAPMESISPFTELANASYHGTSSKISPSPHPGHSFLVDSFFLAMKFWPCHEATCDGDPKRVPRSESRLCFANRGEH